MWLTFVAYILFLLDLLHKVHCSFSKGRGQARYGLGEEVLQGLQRSTVFMGTMSDAALTAAALGGLGWAEHKAEGKARNCNNPIDLQTSM